MLKVIARPWLSFSKQILIRSFKWGTVHPCRSRGCKNIRGQSWRSKKICQISRAPFWKQKLPALHCSTLKYQYTTMQMWSCKILRLCAFAHPLLEAQLNQLQIFRPTFKKNISDLRTQLWTGSFAPAKLLNKAPTHFKCFTQLIQNVSRSCNNFSVQVSFTGTE